MKPFFIFLAALVAIIVILYQSGKKSKPTTRGPVQRPSTPKKDQPAPVTVRLVVKGADEAASDEDSDREWMESRYKERLQEAIERGDEKEILYCQSMLDRTFQKVKTDYCIGDSRLSNMKVDQRVTPGQFEEACNEQIKTTLIYRDMYVKYYQVPLDTDVFKIYAMFLEKQGRYLDAARVCARALNLGFPNDGTQGGMAGRLVRMVKKAGGETTNEIEDALNRYCQ